MAAGTAGYLVLGFSLLEAVYQTVTTITAVGFREVRPLSDAGRIFTIVLILIGVGTALYILTLSIEAMIEGQLQAFLGRRKMERQIGRMSRHVIDCGLGRVGRQITDYIVGAGQDVVVVEQDPARLVGFPHPSVVGDATGAAAGYATASTIRRSASGNLARNSWRSRRRRSTHWRYSSIRPWAS